MRTNDDVIAQIKRAFKDVQLPHPDDVRPHNSINPDYEAVERHFGHRPRIDELTRKDLTEAGSAMIYLPNSAFRYYFPAFLTADLEEPLDINESADFHLTYGLCNAFRTKTHGDESTPWDYKVHLLSMLTTQQIAAFTAYLEVQLAQAIRSDFLSDINRLSEALQNYYHPQLHGDFSLCGACGYATTEIEESRALLHHTPFHYGPVKELIESAFRDSNRQPWNLPGLTVPEEHRRALRERYKDHKDWQAVPTEVLNNGPNDEDNCVLDLMNDAAFRFYLPAFMLADMPLELTQFNLSAQLTKYFDHRHAHAPINEARYGARTFFNEGACRFAGFSQVQLQAVVAYLKYQAAEELIDREFVDRAITVYFAPRIAHLRARERYSAANVGEKS